MQLNIHKEGEYQYVEEGKGPVLLLLHGLFGALSNWQQVLQTFSSNYRVIIPLMPVYEKTKIGASVEGLTEFVKGFTQLKGLEKSTVLGNSLGGHIALMFALECKEQVNGLVLTGSSGLFESGMGTSFPRRSSYDYIKGRVEYTFYSPETATKELVDEVFSIVNDNFKALRVLRIARSAQRHNMRDELQKIDIPTLLVWGLNDNITPARVAHEFHKRLPQSELRFIDGCGHAAMMEQPQQFNIFVKQFLHKHIEQTQA